MLDDNCYGCKLHRKLNIVVAAMKCSTLAERKRRVDAMAAGINVIWRNYPSDCRWCRALALGTSGVFNRIKPLVS